MKLYHGTDIQSAKNLLNGEALDPSKAAKLKLDGPAGFVSLLGSPTPNSLRCAGAPVLW